MGVREQCQHHGTHLLLCMMYHQVNPCASYVPKSSYGTTETAQLLKTSPGSSILRPIPGANPVFLPHQDQDKGAGGVQLYEVVVPSTADDCPPPEMCGADGYYHTNDIFEKVDDDGYVYRGRAGDWIKTVDGFVDTKCAYYFVLYLGVT